MTEAPAVARGDLALRARRAARGAGPGDRDRLRAGRRLRAHASNGAGYDAVGVDPEAPAGARFHRTEFEHYAPPGPVDAVVACTSLHHVDDLDHVVDRIAAAVRPGGTLVVVEWARERFDEHTARWCFDRLPPATKTAGCTATRSAGSESGLPWAAYLDGWAERGTACTAPTASSRRWASGSGPVRWPRRRTSSRTSASPRTTSAPRGSR